MLWGGLVLGIAEERRGREGRGEERREGERKHQGGHTGGWRSAMAHGENGQELWFQVPQP